MEVINENQFLKKKKNESERKQPYGKVLYRVWNHQVKWFSYFPHIYKKKKKDEGNYSSFRQAHP